MLPSVSILTPTKNRSEFLPGLIDMVNSQDYSKELTEWIIIDDSDPEEMERNQVIMKDYFATTDRVETSYITNKEHISLGAKRNMLAEYASGDILINFDDDDIQLSTRISHSVDVLLNYPHYLIAGHSKMKIWDKKLGTIVTPFYGRYHACAGTFAYRKKLMDYTHFESVDMAEESRFLKGYSIPLVQLDYEMTMICVSHSSNTVDKKHCFAGR